MLSLSVGDRRLRVQGRRTPICRLPSEGTERICQTGTPAGPGALVLTRHGPRLRLLLLSSQEPLSCLPSPCLHVSERSVTTPPSEQGHAGTPQCHLSAPGWSLALAAAQEWPRGREGNSSFAASHRLCLQSRP